MPRLNNKKVNASACRQEQPSLRRGVITSESILQCGVGAGMAAGSPSRPQRLATTFEAALGQSSESPDLEGILRALTRGQSKNATRGHAELNVAQPQPPSGAAQGGDPAWATSALNSFGIGTKRASTSSMNMQNRRLPLPLKLYSILANPEHEHILSWMPHGRAWKIHDMDKFQTHILPSYFDSRYYPNNFKNFLQRLKLWGFGQFTRGPDTSAYFHMMLVRGLPELHRMMRPLDASDQKNLHVPDREPNFYPRAPLSVTRTRAKPLSPPPCFSPTMRTFPVTPESPEMAALEGLHSLSRGGTRSQAEMTSPHPLPSPTPVYHVNNSDVWSTNLRMAEELRDLGIQNLRAAKRVSDSRKLSLMPDVSLKATGSCHVAHVQKKPSVQVSPSSVASWTSQYSLALQTKSSPRNKWLPPLGPASTTSSQSTSSSSSSSDNCDWYYTNPEAFASMNESSSSK